MSCDVMRCNIMWRGVAWCVWHHNGCTCVRVRVRVCICAYVVWVIQMLRSFVCEHNQRLSVHKASQIKTWTHDKNKYWHKTKNYWHNTKINIDTIFASIDWIKMLKKERKKKEQPKTCIFCIWPNKLRFCSFERISYTHTHGKEVCVFFVCTVYVCVW